MFTKPTSKEVVHYYSKDAAFDTAAPTFNHRLYVDTGDECHLPRLAGAQPVKFVLRQIPFGAKQYIKDVALTLGQMSAGALLVAYAVARIDPLKGEDGKDIALKHTTEAGFTRLDDAAMEMISAVDDGELYVELMQRARVVAFGDPLSSKE